MNEQALVLGAARSLVGVAAYPETGKADPTKPVLLILNAGHVHRVGPQRLHVKLARQLAEAGYASVRFDFSGIGDSLTLADNLPHEQSIVADVSEVMDDVARLTGASTFCVVGLSSGALASMASAVADPRVVGVGVINPHGFATSEQWVEHVETMSLARIYAGNVLKLDSWRKLLTGKTDYRRMARSLWYRVVGHRGSEAAVASVAEQTRPELEAFLERKVQTLMLFSQQDRSLDNFDEILGPGWQDRLGDKVSVVKIAGANHTFASPAHLKQAVGAVEQWMLRCWPA